MYENKYLELMMLSDSSKENLPIVLCFSAVQKLRGRDLNICHKL